MPRKSALLSVAILLALAPLSSAEKLSKESKKWLDEEAGPIMTPGEEKTFKDMKESDRAEFQKIFWARRDPGLDTPKPENDFRADYLKRKADADQRFRVPGRLGSGTDCGKVFILMGEPDDKKAPRDVTPAPGQRSAEVWTYKDKPSMPFKLRDGKIDIAFDETCQLPAGSKFGEQLTRVAEAKVTRPGLDYRFGKDGKLVKLLDMLPKPTAAQTLLKEPRQDFPSNADTQFLKVSDGGTALVGLVHGRAEGLTSVDTAGKKSIKVTIAAQAVDGEGRVSGSYEQATLAPVGPEGDFAACYRLGLKPGKYTLKIAALDEASKKGSVIEKPVEIPDLNTGELSAASLIAVRSIDENVQNDPAHPYAAYLLGTARLVPFAGTVFSRTDELNLFYQYYDGKVDEASGKASVVASLSILKGDKPVAKAADAPFDIPIGGTVVGPVPLAKYEPGSYLVKLKLTDNVAKKDVTRELVFELK